jgi:hypothetical protein
MWFFVIALVALVVGYALAPKPQSQNAQVGTVEAPTATEGLEIPVLFGTRLIKGPNVVWYGDVKTVAIRKKGGKK